MMMRGITVVVMLGFVSLTTSREPLAPTPRALLANRAAWMAASASFARPTQSRHVASAARSETLRRAVRLERVQIARGARRRAKGVHFGPDVTIYIDGSYFVDSKKGGWAFVVVRDKAPPVVHCGPLLGTEVDKLSGSSAEMMAANKALAWISQQNFPEMSLVEMRPDYATIVPLLAGVAEPKSHIDLVQSTRGLLRQLNRHLVIEWNHVSAHAGHHWNEMVDKFAKEGVDGPCLNQTEETKKPPTDKRRAQLEDLVKYLEDCYGCDAERQLLARARRPSVSNALVVLGFFVNIGICIALVRLYRGARTTKEEPLMAV